MRFFSWNKSKETRQEITAKKTRKDKKQENKKGKKKTRNKKERNREWRRRSERSQRERETLRNEQNNPFSGKTCVFVKRRKTQNTKKGWKPTAPKHTCRDCFFPLVSSWSHILFVYLVHCKSVIHLGFLLSVFFFSSSWWLCFVFLFPSLFLLCSLFLILLFLFPAFLFVWPKNQIKSQNIWNVHFDVLLWCLHPRTFTWPS